MSVVYRLAQGAAWEGTGIASLIGLWLLFEHRHFRVPVDPFDDRNGAHQRDDGKRSGKTQSAPHGAGEPVAHCRQTVEAGGDREPNDHADCRNPGRVMRRDLSPYAGQGDRCDCDCCGFEV